VAFTVFTALRGTERVFAVRSTDPRAERAGAHGGSGTRKMSGNCVPGPGHRRQAEVPRPTPNRCAVSTDPIRGRMWVDLIGLDAAALEVIKVLHPIPVYTSHKLKKGSSNGVTAKARSRAATSEAKRRDEIRERNEELSMYYELPDDRTEWECPELLTRGKRDRVRSCGDKPPDRYSP
jgi:hypothetical protein